MHESWGTVASNFRNTRIFKKYKYQMISVALVVLVLDGPVQQQLKQQREYNSNHG
jgi:hypothetical protein